MSLPFRSADPVGTYYSYNGARAFFGALAFTLSMVYYVRDVGLNPLEMVLVGTTLELACFLFEVPTGIVADLYSRRLSIVIGFVLIGAGLLLQGLVPTFAAILIAQVLWGIGYTFTSGADQAWITDEIGAERAGQVFVRSQQIGMVATIAGTVSAGALGLLSLPLPMTVAGAGMILVALMLALFMREDNFHRTPTAERETFRQMADTFKHGLAVARRRRVVRTLVLISLISGLSSEAFDRLWSVKLLTFDFPTAFGTSDPAFWFTVFALIGTVLVADRFARAEQGLAGAGECFASERRTRGVEPVPGRRRGRVRAAGSPLAGAGRGVDQRDRRPARVADRVRVAEPHHRIPVPRDRDLDGGAGERDRPGRRRSPARRRRPYVVAHGPHRLRPDPHPDPPPLPPPPSHPRRPEAARSRVRRTASTHQRGLDERLRAHRSRTTGLQPGLVSEGGPVSRRS